MEKTLTIAGRQVKFKSTGAFLLRYKMQFKKDPLKDIFKLRECIDENGKLTDLEALDMELFFNLIWVLAKTADPEIPEPFDWLDSFAEFPLTEILPELAEMIVSTMVSTVDSKKK